jgi:hypothetical protein
MVKIGPNSLKDRHIVYIPGGLRYLNLKLLQASRVCFLICAAHSLLASGDVVRDARIPLGR